jgi:hypothetical protein
MFNLFGSELRLPRRACFRDVKGFRSGIETEQFSSWTNGKSCRIREPFLLLFIYIFILVKAYSVGNQLPGL